MSYAHDQLTNPTPADSKRCDFAGRASRQWNAVLPAVARWSYYECDGHEKTETQQNHQFMLQGAISIESDGDGGSGGALAAKLKILRAAHWPTENQKWPGQPLEVVSWFPSSEGHVPRFPAVPRH